MIMIDVLQEENKKFFKIFTKFDICGQNVA